MTRRFLQAAGYVAAGVLVASTSIAQAPNASDLLREALGGVAFGDSVSKVTDKLDGLCEKLERHDVAPPALPLARKAQTHLIAEDVPTAGVDEVAFTFGDDALVLVEARGGAVDGLLSALEGVEPMEIQGYRAWPAASVVAHPERDAIWLLSPAALHTNLFLWENPDLPSVRAPEGPYSRSAERPEILAFGATLEALMPRIEKAASFWSREEIRTPWLPTQPRTQVQINCFGVPYAGFPRKVEAVFGDDTLQLAWILTGKQEEERVREDLIRAFGKPHFVSEQWESFDDWRVSLRKDKPEVLVIDDALVPTYRKQIEASAAK